MKVSYFRKISKMMISSFIFLFIIALIIDSIQSFDINYLKKASLFADEICSFSGDPILKDDGSVECYAPRSIVHAKTFLLHPVRFLFSFQIQIRECEHRSQQTPYHDICYTMP